MDITFQTNYWLGFPESNSDILLNLTHWQYWWWFWFTYLLCLYYFFFLRLLKNRLLKFKPKIVTSYKARGKWGDFLVCLLPVTWCVNILSNSNFILRMLEWQTQSSLFTVRVRGRQWYWIYKIEIKTMVAMNNVLKNLGHSYWLLFSNTNLNYIEDYSNILQLKNNKIFLKEYVLESFNALSLNENNDLSRTFVMKNNIFLLKNINNNVDLVTKHSDLISVPKLVKNVKNTQYLSSLKLNSTVKKNIILFELISKNSKNSILNKNISKFVKRPYPLNYGMAPKFINNFKEYTKNNSLLNSVSINGFKYKDLNRMLRYNYFSKIRSTKINFLDNNFITNFTDHNNNTFTDKNVQENIYLVIKQKRFIPIKKVKLFSNKSLFLTNNSYLSLIDNDKIVTKFMYKTLKAKPHNFSHMYYRRLLRTKRILVLPTNVNITLITNSFDVVHSWYIPGLGIKLDCVPGRSTHHTINIDHAGFYYGQCAEICGRYHHHMPIRVCALPFEHFLVWWYHFGIPYFNSVKTTRKISVKSGLRQYNW